MTLETTSLLLCLKAVHLTAIVGWMAGQLCIWRVHVQRTMGAAASPASWLGRLDRRVLQGVTAVAAVLALFSGAGLLTL